ncbi:hypothetical protein KAJ89_00615 [Candidatus Parcubacteria bacterium]|nr:hypothetical protein [Candidatus Parcubacteria bacterium]
MKNIIKKTFKFIFSRAFYLFIGLFLSVGVYSVYAAWNNTVNPNDPLTAVIWNEHVQKLIEVDSRISSLESGTVALSCMNVTCSCAPFSCLATCPSGYTVTGGGGNPNINGDLILSLPSGNGWRCGLAAGGTCYARCCRIQ